ncbi:MAG: NifB/NifX family molybdenum-iron cluster-binding protein [Bacillota bacterium]
MKLAVCARAEGPDAPVDDRFGRCPYFVITDLESGEVKSLLNDGVGASGGAGPQAASLLSENGVDAVVVGNIGPNAVRVLEASGIRVYSGLKDTVKETVEKYKKGELTSVSNPSVPSHFGLRR